MSMHPKLCRYVAPPPRVWPTFVLAFAFGLSALFGVAAIMKPEVHFR